MIRAAATLVFLTLVGWAPSPALAQAATLSSQRTITISALGLATARPDQASVRIAVVTDATTAKAVVAANSAAMRPVIDALKGAGVDAKDIQTANFNVQPQYEYFQDGKPPKLTGYQANNSVEVLIRDVAKLGDTLDAAIGNGSNQVSGISFVVSNAEVLKDEARKAAVANATRMAKIYADAAGVALGDLQSLTESSNPREFAPAPMAMAPRSKGAAPPPIEPGQESLEAEVTMVWSIK